MRKSAISRVGLAAFFIVAGANHFLSPAIYRSIVPRFLPWPEALVAVSGGAEIIGGIDVLIPRTQRFAGGGLIALLVAVFPANIASLHSGIAVAGRTLPSWVLWARLPLQVVFIAWVYRVCFPDDREPNIELANRRR